MRNPRTPAPEVTLPLPNVPSDRCDLAGLKLLQNDM